MSEALGYFCPECLFPGALDEFQTNNDELAPDLADSGVCPECGCLIENMDEQEFE